MPVLYSQGGKPKSFINSAGLANEFVPAGGSAYIDVHGQFPWTYSYKARERAPYIVLKEYAVNESAIKRQLFFYTAGAANFVGGGDRLAPYAELFPRDQETGFVYRMPFFTDINFELNTPQWKSLDTLEAAGNAVEGFAGTVMGKGAAKFVDKAKEFAGGAILAGLSLGYPKVGIMDRPKLWESHDFRSYTIKFPLFNTKQNTTKYYTEDWEVNRELCFLFINQNLFNKRDFITGIPPVYYEVTVPGQHYSYASCVTNITVNNRGNVRLLTDSAGNKCNVPDVYEVNITLTDMVMPSKNLFQTINEQTVVGKVSQSTRSETTDTVGDSLSEGARDVIDIIVGDNS
jgi:hypothetical protein